MASIFIFLKLFFSEVLLKKKKNRKGRRKKTENGRSLFFPLSLFLLLPSPAPPEPAHLPLCQLLPVRSDRRRFHPRKRAVASSLPPCHLPRSLLYKGPARAAPQLQTLAPFPSAAAIFLLLPLCPSSSRAPPKPSRRKPRRCRHGSRRAGLAAEEEHVDVVDTRELEPDVHGIFFVYGRRRLPLPPRRLHVTAVPKPVPLSIDLPR